MNQIGKDKLYKRKMREANERIAELETENKALNERIAELEKPKKEEKQAPLITEKPAENKSSGKKKN